MMLSISTELSGDTIILDAKPESLKRETDSRITRTKLLDGTVHISNYGVCDGDQTFIIEAEYSGAEEGVLLSIFSGGLKVILTRYDGSFKGNIASLNLEFGNAKITFLVEEKMS